MYTYKSEILSVGTKLFSDKATAEERQKTFTDMMELALEAAVR